MTTRPAGPADLDAVRACARAAFQPYVAAIGREPAPMHTDFAAACAAGQLQVIEADGTPAGFIHLVPEGAAMQVESLAVADAFRGVGLGRALMAHAEARAAALGCTAVTLYTNAKMTRNLAWYADLGYRVTRRAEADGFDRVYFRKELSAHPSTGDCMQRRGILIILSSPSGAGKSTLSRRLLESDPAVRFSVSATTRPPRVGEVDGREYHFRSRAEFEAMVAAGEMLEHAEVFGNLYGSPRGPVETALAEGRDILFDVDWQGGQQIRASDLSRDCVSIFILPPSMAALQARLSGRGQDSAEVVAGRMAQSRGEISHWREYDYVLVNENADAASAELAQIVAAERLRRWRRVGLDGFVAGLDREFEEMQP